MASMFIILAALIGNSEKAVNVSGFNRLTEYYDEVYEHDRNSHT